MESNTKKFATGGNIPIATLKKIVSKTVSLNPQVFQRLSEI